MTHRIVWVDIPVLNLARAMTFYSKVLDAEVTEEHPGVAVIAHSDNDVAGCLAIDENMKPSRDGALIYLNASGRLQEATDAAVAHGGELLEEPRSIGPWGSRSVVVDSEGNRIALHSE
jgi:predicted enzyme related to lactoylglutathione lyase